MKSQQISQKGFKCLIWIIGLFFTSYAATLVLQNRIIAVGHLSVCAAILAYPLSYTLGDIIAEVYGFQIARSLIYAGIISWLIIASLIEITIHAPIPPFWVKYDHAYDFVMAPVFRGVVLGIISVLLGQIVNIYLLTKLKTKTRGKYFILRSISSTAVGDFLTVVLALFGVFYGRMHISNIINLIIYEYIFMVFYAIIMSIPAAVIARYLKKTEGESNNYYDEINPFRVEQNG
jgi:queuosine precursor transporter